MRIAVIGAGAIGGITAAFLAKDGYEVTLVAKHQEIVDRAMGKGLHITGVKGEHFVPMQAVCKVEELQGKYDAILIATKAYDMPQAAKQALPFVEEDGLFVSMQNGICTDAMAEVVGQERTVGSVIGFGASMLGPGELEMTSQGEFILGMPDGSVPETLRELQKALDHVVPTQITEHLLSELYSKLIVNSCITSLGAVCGKKLGEMMKIKQARRIFLSIIDEAMQVADGMGIHVFAYGGKLNYYNLMKGDSGLANFKRHAMIRIVGMKYKNLKSSSLQSLERGQKTEIDYFNGYIAKKGRELGIATPVCDRLVEMIRQIENQERRIEEKNLYDAAFENLKY